MEITKTMNGTQLVLALSGRLDTTTAPQLEAELNASLDSASELVLDVTGLEYLSSAGLRVILSALKRLNAKQGKLTLLHPNETVLEILEVTGFRDILTVEL